MEQSLKDNEALLSLREAAMDALKAEEKERDAQRKAAEEARRLAEIERNRPHAEALKELLARKLDWTAEPERGVIEIDGIWLAVRYGTGETPRPTYLVVCDGPDDKHVKCGRTINNRAELGQWLKHKARHENSEPVLD